jgi:hypothetical protein
MAQPLAADASVPSRLPPLRWIAEEELLYDTSSRTLHRPGCPHVDALTLRKVPAGSALKLVWAPLICRCGPDVTLSLG